MSSQSFLDGKNEPDDIIVIHPLKINEPDGVILYYKEAGLFVYDQLRIPIHEIADITARNDANPYIQGHYQIMITMKDKEKHYIPVGDDPENAHAVLSALFEKMEQTALD